MGKSNWRRCNSKYRKREWVFYKTIINIRKKGLKIILIADEAHRNLSTELNTNLINKIKPNIFIYASATPDAGIYMSADKKCDVSLDDVKKTELIKKSLIIDNTFKEIKEGNMLEKIISSAVNKRNELEKLYLDEKKCKTCLYYSTTQCKCNK